MIVTLTDLDATTALARAFAQSLAQTRHFPALLMNGQLGAGKTTFVRALVGFLPGSEKAEVSSPSFNIVNLYPTTPPVAHFDLYRTSGQGFSPDLEEILDSDALCLMEWAEFLPDSSRPESFVSMVWNVEDEIRTVQFSASDNAAQEFLDRALRNIL